MTTRSAAECQRKCAEMKNNFSASANGMTTDAQVCLCTFVSHSGVSVYVCVSHLFHSPPGCSLLEERRGRGGSDTQNGTTMAG